MSNVIEISQDQFIDEVVEKSKTIPVIVDFWAPWCGPCKQLTPILEKIISKSEDKITLVKINIDENQQIAAQLRIQSIPTVYAFKDKQIVNAFQGVIPEGQIIEFIEKCLGSKINEDFTEFYNEIESAMAENKFEETKDTLLEFISKNSDEIKGICFYLECLIELKQFEEVDVFINSLEKDVKETLAKGGIYLPDDYECQYVKTSGQRARISIFEVSGNLKVKVCSLSLTMVATR